MKSRSDNDKVNEVRLLLGSLYIYRNLLDDPVISRFNLLLQYTARIDINEAEPDKFIDLYCSFFHSLAGFSKSVNFTEYIIDKIMLDENTFTLMSASFPTPGISPELMSAVKADLQSLHAVAVLSANMIKTCFIEKISNDESNRPFIEKLSLWNCSQDVMPDYRLNSELEIRDLLMASDDWGKCYNDLVQFHKTNGNGIFTKYRAFMWQNSCGFGKLLPVNNPDPVKLVDLIAYETEQEEVIKNTQQFLKGYSANNVLLYGDRGTGKSSTVKAILNEYCSEGLRMIEVPKKHLVDFPDIVRGLSGRNLKFIIFIDDLAFEDNEENYTALKAVLEGSLELKPENVIIYATSNRRHLIKEKFSDRAGLAYGSLDDEVRAADSMQEKLSLSDRFGITVIFSSPDKNRYLYIIEELAARRGISIDRERLHKEALKWELWYNGRSPRTAQQFVSWLESNDIL
jgi:uncharacterized protein